MKYIFESKETSPIDEHTAKEQAISKARLKKMMVSFEVMVNTMYPELRVHLKVNSD